MKEKTELTALLDKPEFPRSRHYDHDWMLDNQMGPNAVWLAEWLSNSLDLKPGMRLLDLGCGRAISSIFLAREYNVAVWAADLWIGPDNNWQRVQAAGVAERVIPLRMEAHAIPFAAGFFDAVVSIDAYQYFGTDVLYLSYLSRFVRPGGQLAVVVPGLMQPISDDPPPHLLQPQANGSCFWENDCWSFLTAYEWLSRWRRCAAVCELSADTMPEGWRHWRDFERALELSGKGVFPSAAEALDRDRGAYIGLLRLRAQKAETQSENLYDPGLGAQVGID
ncbi:MAG: methyltransferase domain-containing protein [Spirochaetaceae bacterium]|nr:MAG: methyltransferase domain-containing protein [Spirochaetaceae bacterium]